MRRLGLTEHCTVHRYAVRYVQGRTESLPRELWKYNAQRYTLFSRFDEGVKLDKQMWYSVTPESIARSQALRAANCGQGRGGVLIDGFCGAGSNSIQFAQNVSSARSCFVLGLDVRMSRLRATNRHAKIYGVDNRIDLVCADFRSTPRLFRQGVANGVFLSPPWADKGEVPSESGAFSLRRLALGLDGAKLLRAALSLSPDVAIFLPRVVSRQEVRALAVLARSDVVIQEHIRITRGQAARHPTAVTCYFGAWARHGPSHCAFR